MRDERRKGIATDFAIHSIIVVMDIFKKLKELKIFLRSLTAYKGLHIFYTNPTIEAKAVEIALNKDLDMDDSIQYAAALSANAECIVSYDEHFDNLDIKRKTPETLV